MVSCPCLLLLQVHEEGLVGTRTRMIATKRTLVICGPIVVEKVGSIKLVLLLWPPILYPGAPRLVASLPRLLLSLANMLLFF